MRGIYNFETINSTTALPLFKKIVNTFALWLIVFFLLGLTVFAFFAKTMLSEQETLMFLKLFTGILITFCLLSILILTILIKKSLFPLLELIEKMNFLEKLRSVDIPTDASQEIEKIYEIVNSNIERLNEFQGQLVEAERKLAVGEIALQVSHDIRSPLAALNMAIAKILSNLDEQDRVIIRSQIRRIEDIANNLMMHNKRSHVSLTDSPELLSSCLGEILTEKRLEFRSELGLNIEEFLNNSYGLFARVNSSEFKSIISNIINNAFEALEGSKGTIRITLDEDCKNAKIIIEDNGKGIPPEILDRLGKEIYSFGKEGNSKSGSGLGLYQAKKHLQKWGGQLEIESTLNLGTKVILKIPISISPDWFLDEINVASNSTIVILDDDQSIHQTWNSRFFSGEFDNINLNLVHIPTPELFRKWVLSNHSSNVLYLCDFELIGHETTGLDLIEALEINSQSILVTSRYEEEKIKNRAIQGDIKILPKMLAGFIPIKVKNNMLIDCVLIDDDKYIRHLWQNRAEELGLNFLALSTTADFSEHLSLISKNNTRIYIDSNLGSGVERGEKFAETLNEMGFEKLYLTTGYDAEIFSEIHWLKCVSKNANIELI